jgi:hypothetical protein
MIHPPPLESFAAPIQKALSAPGPLRMMAARGMAPLPPPVLVSVVYLTQFDADEALATAAKGTFAKLPPPILDGALGAPDLHPAVLDALATAVTHRRDIDERIVKHAAADASTIVVIARRADEALCELIATNEHRLLSHKEIIETLYLNDRMRMSTADRLCEFAARNGLVLDIPGFAEIAKSLENALIPEPGEESPVDELFRQAIEEAEAVGDAPDGDLFERNEHGEVEKVKGAFEKVVKRIEDMSISEKIRIAMLGSASQRRLLACSPIRSIAEAAIKSPRMQPDEVQKLAMLPEANEEVLRAIARRGDWLKSSRTRYYLARNPKTPSNVALAQLSHLTEFDLKALEKARTVPFQIRNIAKQILDKRTEKRTPNK